MIAIQYPAMESVRALTKTERGDLYTPLFAIDKVGDFRYGVMVWTLGYVKRAV